MPKLPRGQEIKQQLLDFGGQNIDKIIQRNIEINNMPTSKLENIHIPR
jgi:hypothetical protein